MGLRSMAAALEEMYHPPNFPERNPLSAIARLIEPEYPQKMNKRMTNRLRSDLITIKPSRGELYNGDPCLEDAQLFGTTAPLCGLESAKTVEEVELA